MTGGGGGVLVISRYHPDSIEVDDNANGEPKLESSEQRNDNLDSFNHPRYRRARILLELKNRSSTAADPNHSIQFETPSTLCLDFSSYRLVTTEGLLDFLTNAWDRWDTLGSEGRQDPLTSLSGKNDSNSSPALIPGNFPLPREKCQKPSNNVMGQIGYYCTDTVTPIFAQLFEENLWDAAVMEHAITATIKSHKRSNNHNYGVVYALTTHPGHHAASDSFGGYCYLNHAAYAARRLQQKQKHHSGFQKVAILDVDYHCGNGSASIFYDDPTVLMISIHCHPDYDYPFHTGLEEETGTGDGEGTTLHLPLLPGTTWNEYSVALDTAMKRFQSFGAEALVVSMGLDTYDGDPCAVRRAGFKLCDNDYVEMGKTIGTACSQIPVLVVQEGGYRMDRVPIAATDVLVSIAQAKNQK